MEIAKLVLEYLKALIWPAAFVFATLTFKAQIAALFGRLRILRGGVAEAEFAEAVADLRAETEVAAAEQQPLGGTELLSTEDVVTMRFHDVLEPMLSLSPALAVLTGWDYIRSRLISMAREAKHGDWTDDGSGIASLRVLENRGLPGATARSIRRLTGLRNQVAHPHPRGEVLPLTEEAGRDYVDAAVNVWEALTAFQHRLRDEAAAD
ncbi:hypothetical protein [Streptomyces collinus]|uniref:hypothetical protein n=1 Tax=Streptomyces collinus TaxID=42684 RepID=UPI0036AC9F59